MNTFTKLMTATALIAASATAALADRDASVPSNFGEQVSVPAASVLSLKELHKRGLSGDEQVTVTKAGQGSIFPERGGDK